MNKLLSYLLLFFALNTFSQKEANFWYFGEGAGLDFQSNPPNVITGSLSTDEGSASISNANGILQLYTDGSIVYNKTGAVMDNGTGLLGNSSSSQSAIIVPKPLNSNIYYVFTVGNQTNNGGNGVAFSTIDMSLNSGLGGVTTKNTFLAGSNNAREKITAVRGKKCNTFWVITLDNSNFYAYLIDENGVTNTAITSAHNNNLNNLRGYLKISPDGKTIVNASANSGSYIFDFDADTGIITNGGRLNVSGGYGVEFSRNGQKLYVSSGVHSQVTGSGRNPPDYASILQFSLASRDIGDINASSKLVYETNVGYRGALQLASNGKIYYARSRQTFLGIINSPEKEASDVNFIENGLSLNGNISTEGLPPFIQSFFLEIEIKDQDDDFVVNNQDLKYCIGQDKIINPETITGKDINYLWTFDNGTTLTTISSSPTQANLELKNISFADQGTYQLKITLKDDCDNDVEYNGTFKVEVYEAATATKPKDIIFCDTDRDGFNFFNLQDNTVDGLKDEILTGLDTSKFDVLFFLNIADAATGDNPLPNPYQNPTAFSSQTIYARVQNKNAPNACFATTSFILKVTDLPVPIQPTPYRICDDLESGDDTDKIINTFVLQNKDDEIYGSLDINQYNISYHTTQVGADTNDTTTIIDKNANHTVVDFKTVFVRIENKDNKDCFDTSVTLKLIVDPLPVLKANPEIDQCVSANNANPTVNLTFAESNISETPNVTFKYYEDVAGLNQITNTTSYPVTVNTTQSVFVKVTSDKNCARDLIELKINVGQTPDNPYADIQPPVCDDFLDANGNNTTGSNDDTDNITNFSLDKTAIIAGINPPTNTKVTFYENINDRANSLNEIDITNYRNDINKIDITDVANGKQFPIYYKILSTVNQNCQGLGQFYLQINATPKVSNNSLTSLQLCDTGAIDGNYTNGSNKNIDLTQQIDEIFQGTGQDKNDFNVTFYKTAIAVASGDTTSADYITNRTLFTNDVPAGFTQGNTVTQTIFVRVENKSSGCANPHASFNVVINPLPIITNLITPLSVCDAGTKDGNTNNSLAQNIDVSVRDIEVLGTRNAADFTITYHKTKADLENISSTGIDKNSYDSDPSRVTINPTTKISEEQLFIRILNKSTNCFFDQSILTIIVNPEPTSETISNLSQCDNNNDDDDTNGIIQNIDLDGKIPEILGASQDPDDYIVTFHANPADASTGNNKLDSPYTNTSATETIYVHIQNKATLCINNDASFDVIINPLPDFSVITPQILCLNNLPLNIAVKNPSDVYSYVWTDQNGTVLNTVSTDNIDIANAGTYKVTATTTNGTQCSKSEEITVKKSDVAILEDSFITIIDESNNISNNDNISIFIDTLKNDLGPGDYQFAIRNDDNNQRIPNVGFQDDPLFENLEGGIYTVIVNDKNGCSPDTELQISVIQFPKFFTPNSDGKNDTWAIKGANKTFYPNSSINIFNRFGKIVAQIPIDSQGWNGTYNGKILPSDDYWFNIQLIPADKTKAPILKKGHFSLLRK